MPGHVPHVDPNVTHVVSQIFGLDGTKVLAAPPIGPVLGFFTFKQQPTPAYLFKVALDSALII